VLNLVVAAVLRASVCAVLLLHNERTVPIIMAGYIAHARDHHISTSGEKYDVTIVFLDPDFLNDVKILAIRPYILGRYRIT